MNTVVSAGIYTSYNGNAPSNLPSGLGGNCLMRISNFGSGNTRVLQEVYERNGGGAMAYRYGTISGEFENWLLNYDSSILTDSTVLSSLASALKPYLEAL